MVEEIHKVKDKGRIPNKDIHHPGSSNSSNSDKTRMTIRVREGPSPLKIKCCSSWGTIRGRYTSMNRNYLNTSASLKNLETQVRQLALNIQTQNKGEFPSDTQKNPKDCMAVRLRSGKEVGNSNRKERKEETEEEQ